MTRPERSAGSRPRRVPLRLLAIALFGLAGCTDAAGYDLDYILAKAPFIGTMRRTVSYDSHTLPRLPAEGTVPVISPMGEVIPPFTQVQLDSAAATLSNPLPASPEVLARGAVVYRNNCFACHGEQGQGNGPVVGNGRFPLGPDLVGAAAAGRSDGYIYAVIRVGRGLMPSYGERITHEDRWAVVHHIRQLQGRPAAAAVAPAATTPVAGATPAAAAVPPAQ